MCRELSPNSVTLSFMKRQEFRVVLNYTSSTQHDTLDKFVKCIENEPCKREIVFTLVCTTCLHDIMEFGLEFVSCVGRLRSALYGGGADVLGDLWSAARLRTTSMHGPLPHRTLQHGLSISLVINLGSLEPECFVSAS